MPKFVLKKISYDINENTFADDAGNVTVMFVYICNFNELVENNKNNILIILDEIFREFDNQCEKFGV